MKTFFNYSYELWDFPSGSDSKESTTDAGDVVWLLSQEDSLEKEMATHSSTVAWRISRTEESGGPQDHKV